MAVVNEAAFEAANAWTRRVGNQLPPELILGVIQAAQPHLEAGQPPVPSIDYPRHWGSGAIEREHAHRERMARWSAEKEFQRGVSIGRAEREAELLDAQVLHAEAGPTDYEVWRDALTIAALTVAVKGDTDEVVYVARQLVGTLRRAGARIEDDPVDDFAPDDVVSPVEESNGWRADEEPRRQNADLPQAELDALNDQAETDHAEREGERKAQEAFDSYPGHDMSVTVGGCRPSRPCPACRQRIGEPAGSPDVTPDGVGTGEWSGRAGG